MPDISHERIVAVSGSFVRAANRAATPNTTDISAVSYANTIRTKHLDNINNLDGVTSLT